MLENMCILLCEIVKTKKGSDSMTNRPFDVLNGAIGKEVLIILKGDLSVRGTLKAFDIHMNILLENAEQLANGELKTKFGKLMIRGDNILFVSP